MSVLRRIGTRRIGRREMSRVHHPAVRVVGFTVLLAGVQGAIAVLTARWLGPSERGVFAIGVGIASFSLVIGSLGVYTGGRVLLSDPRSGFTWRSYWRLIAVLTFVQGLAVVVVDIPVWQALTSPQRVGTLTWFGAYCLLMTAGSLAREGAHGLGRHLRATMSDVVAALTQLGLAGALEMSGHITVSGLFACGAAGFALQIVICQVTRQLDGHHQTAQMDRPTLRIWTVIRFSAPGLVLITGQLLIQKGDRLILGMFADPKDVGIYSAGATIADAAWIIPTSVSVFVLREVAANHALEPLKKWWSAIMLATAINALVIAVCASTLIHYLLGDQYAESTLIVWILCAGSVLFASQQIDISACNGMSRLNVGARVTGWGALTLIVLSFALMPAYKSTGAAIASVSAYGCMAILARRATRRLQIQFGGEQGD